MATAIEAGEDIINVSDITDRVEELRDERESFNEENEPEGPIWDEAHAAESSDLASLEELLEELRGSGGDHQWLGDWYPGYLIRDSHFKEYAQQLAEDLGAMPDPSAWPGYCIDWDYAVRELQMDYSSVEFEGYTYWYR